MPTFNSNDTLYVYSLKTPMLEYEVGEFFGKYNMYSDAIAFHHVQSGSNFTMEWYGLGQLLNCTFPHAPTNDSLVWCNQAAACFSRGIDESRWSASVAPVKVAEMNGTAFSLFASWTEKDNNTNVFYETWTVMDQPGGQTWFNSCDSSSWVQRAFTALAESGASFNRSVQLKHTRLNLYSEQPKLLGTAAAIFNDPSNTTIAEEILKFYQRLQPVESLSGLIGSYLDIYYTVVVQKRFYLFYDDQYWLLPMQDPYVNVTYEKITLP